jgi:hypothetical protein
MKQTPNTKHQTPGKLQIPNPKSQPVSNPRLLFGVWDLFGVWCLVFGVSPSFVQAQIPRSRTTPNKFPARR